MADHKTTPERLPLTIHGDGGPGTMAHGEVEDVLRWANERGLKITHTLDGKAAAQVVTDWRALLVRYMTKVIGEEGDSYINIMGFSVDLTEAEKAELSVIEAEARKAIADAE